MGTIGQELAWNVGMVEILYQLVAKVLRDIEPFLGFNGQVVQIVEKLDLSCSQNAKKE